MTPGFRVLHIPAGTARLPIDSKAGLVPDTHSGACLA